MKYLVHTQIEIDAPPAMVWDLLVDLDNYHRWNPFIVEARGRIAPEARLWVSPQLTERRRQTFEPIVTSYVEGVEFAWTGTILHPLFAKGEHIFRLTELSPGRVRLVHDEVFSGIGGGIAGLVAGKITERGFDAMNRALKEQVEAKA